MLAVHATGRHTARFRALLSVATTNGFVFISVMVSLYTKREVVVFRIINARDRLYHKLAYAERFYPGCSISDTPGHGRLNEFAKKTHDISARYLPIKDSPRDIAGFRRFVIDALEASGDDYLIGAIAEWANRASFKN